LLGATDCEPLEATDPMPAIETVVALVVDHVSVVASPVEMVVGETVSEAVGACGAGAGAVEVEDPPHPESSRASTMSAKGKCFISAQT